jgi:hypothetical protein
MPACESPFSTLFQTFRNKKTTGRAEHGSEMILNYTKGNAEDRSIVSDG